MPLGSCRQWRARVWPAAVSTPGRHCTRGPARRAAGGASPQAGEQRRGDGVGARHVLDAHRRRLGAHDFRKHLVQRSAPQVAVPVACATARAVAAGQGRSARRRAGWAQGRGRLVWKPMAPLLPSWRQRHGHPGTHPCCRQSGAALCGAAAWPAARASGCHAPAGRCRGTTGGPPPPPTTPVRRQSSREVGGRVSRRRGGGGRRGREASRRRRVAAPGRPHPVAAAAPPAARLPVSPAPRLLLRRCRPVRRWPTLCGWRCGPRRQRLPSGGDGVARRTPVSPAAYGPLRGRCMAHRRCPGAWRATRLPLRHRNVRRRPACMVFGGLGRVGDFLVRNRVKERWGVGILAADRASPPGATVPMAGGHLVGAQSSIRLHVRAQHRSISLPPLRPLVWPAIESRAHSLHTARTRRQRRHSLTIT